MDLFLVHVGLGLRSKREACNALTSRQTSSLSHLLPTGDTSKTTLGQCTNLPPGSFDNPHLPSASSLYCDRLSSSMVLYAFSLVHSRGGPRYSRDITSCRAIPSPNIYHLVAETSR